METTIGNLFPKNEKFKCGEVYRCPEGSLGLKCILCSIELNNLDIFSEHIAIHWDQEIVKLGTVEKEELIDEAIKPENDQIWNGEIKSDDDECYTGFETEDFDDKSTVFPQIYAKELSIPIENSNSHNVDQLKDDQIEEKIVKCPFCKEMFYCHAEKHRHELIHGVNNYCCDICVFASSAKRSLLKHMRLNHYRNSPVNLNKCKICESNFATEADFLKHKTFKKPKRIRNKGKKEKFSVKCGEHCSMEFSSGIRLYRHYKKYGLKPIVCTQCPLRFRDPYSLKMHVRQHTGDKPNKCEICDKYFPSISAVKIHLRTHSEEKLYQCELCGEKFKSSSKLSLHRKKHKGTFRTRICDICGKAFPYPSLLMVHKRTHTGEKPFNCDQCDKSFISKNVLYEHVQRAHKGIRPFKCRHNCETTFLYATSRILHEKKYHSSEIMEENLFETERSTK